MAQIYVKEGTDMSAVAAALWSEGIQLGRRLSDGSYVAYIHRRRWMCIQYPDLAPLYEEDRAFWKSVRKRTRQGEHVPMEEIETHAKQFNEQEKAIIAKYERSN